MAIQTQTKRPRVKKVTKLDLIDTIFTFNDEQIKKIIPILMSEDNLMSHKKEVLEQIINTVFPKPIEETEQKIEQPETVA